MFFVAALSVLGVQSVNATVSNPPTSLPLAPTHNAADVLSIYSEAYTNVATFSGLTGVGDVKEERTVLGDKMLYFENGFNSWSYINFESPVNIDTYDVIFMDIYVVAGTTTDLKVSFAEGSSTFNIRVTEGWNKVEIDLNDYRILATPPDFTQVGKIGIINAGGYARTIYIDNIYACKTVPTELLYAPTQPASSPKQKSANVLPVFTNAYPNEVGLQFNSSTPGDIKKFKGIDYTGISNLDKMIYIKNGLNSGDGGLDFPQPIDVSGYDSIHMDLYLVDAASLPLRFRFGLGTGAIAPNPTATVATAVTGWNSININLRDFVALTTTGYDLTTMNGFGFWHKTGGKRTVFVDNIYFYKKGITTGLNELSEKVQLMTYPNPVIDNLSINSERTINSVQVYNLAGQNIKTVQGKGNRLDINLQDNMKGVYTLQILLEDGNVVTKKIVKM